jgi:hypothetical protein
MAVCLDDTYPAVKMKENSVNKGLATAMTNLAYRGKVAPGWEALGINKGRRSGDVCFCLKNKVALLYSAKYFDCF